MPMNRVPWSLQNNVHQVIKNPSAQVPWVPEHSSALWGSERLECSSSLSASSGLCAGEPLVLECSSAYRLPKKFPNGTTFGSLFVQIKTFVKYIALNVLFSCQDI